MGNGVILADYAPDGCPLAAATGDAGRAKRHQYWARQAASCYWARQAASLLASPSGVITSLAKRCSCRVCETLQATSQNQKRAVFRLAVTFTRNAKSRPHLFDGLKPILRPASGVKPGLASSSVHVALVAAFCAQVVQVLFRIFRTHAASAGDSIDQGMFDIARHTRRIAANINVCAALQPRP